MCKVTGDHSVGRFPCPHKEGSYRHCMLLSSSAMIELVKRASVPDLCDTMPLVQWLESRTTGAVG